MVQTVSVSIDVSNIAIATDFYLQALGCVFKTKYSESWAVVSIAGVDIHFLERDAGTIAGGEQKRHYERHWTPVHLDFGVENVEPVLALVKEFGGSVENFITGDTADIAHCADPFGNGFCLIRE
jgi:predicted enzyme related to lactoylglutathione lyase